MKRSSKSQDTSCSLPQGTQEITLLKAENETLKKQDQEGRETLRRLLEKMKKLEHNGGQNGPVPQADLLKELSQLKDSHLNLQKAHEALQKELLKPKTGQPSSQSQEIMQLKELNSAQETAHLDLQKAHEALQKELAELKELKLQQETALQKSVEALQQELAQLQELAALELQKQHKELSQGTEDLKNKLQHANGTKEQALIQVEVLNSEAISLRQKIGEQEGKFRLIEAERSEHEIHLRTAQQHLAKKVREATILTEQNQKFREQLIKHEEAARNSEKKLEEALEVHEKEKLARSKQQESYQQQLKILETKCIRLEEKYLHAQKEIHQLESQNQEFKGLEERFSKLQKALSHFQDLLVPQKSESHIEHVPSKIDAVVIQPSLFQIPSPSSRYKETLFG